MSVSGREAKRLDAIRVFGELASAPVIDEQRGHRDELNRDLMS